MQQTAADVKGYRPTDNKKQKKTAFKWFQFSSGPLNIVDE